MPDDPSLSESLPDSLPDSSLPSDLYRVASVVALERVAIDQHAIPDYELMTRAGQAAFDLMRSRYAQSTRIAVVCGAGNNAGDGYVLARLAKQAGLDVSVVSLIDTGKLSGPAKQAFEDWLQVGDLSDLDYRVIQGADVIIDAMLGTGLARDLDALWSGWIKAINNAGRPVLALDIPSGLYADTGEVSNAGAVIADITISFIGLKQGMFTGFAGDHCGRIILHRLGLTEDILSQQDADAVLLQAADISRMPPRPASSHKGLFGHVLIVGGNRGMPGAVVLAARAALRTGAGKVTVVTHPDNLSALVAAVPEAMIRRYASEDDAEQVFSQAFLDSISHIAVGPGLGIDDWSKSLLRHCIACNKPMLADADALNIMATSEHDSAFDIGAELIITPHPGEAKRLLKTRYRGPLDSVLDDRFAWVRALQSLFEKETVVVLKGYGSLIDDGEKIRICHAGNPAMASAGMGDVLSGIITALWAQGLSARDAVELGVCLHACTADRVVSGHGRGLVASDITDNLHYLLP